MTLRVQCEREADGRWIADVVDLPGAVAYGATADEATVRAKALALRVVGERLEHGETDPHVAEITFVQG